jgi:hypothetical protein
MTNMRRLSKNQAIRNAFFRLGLHTKPKGVVDDLRERGIQVDEELFRQVRFELLKETTGARAGEIFKPASSPPVRHRPQGFPGDTKDDDFQQDKGIRGFPQGTS